MLGALHRLVFPVLGIGVAAGLTYWDKMGPWSFVAALAVCNGGYYVESFFLARQPLAPAPRQPSDHYRQFEE